MTPGSLEDFSFPGCWKPKKVLCRDILVMRRSILHAMSEYRHIMTYPMARMSLEPSAHRLKCSHASQALSLGEVRCEGPAHK